MPKKAIIAPLVGSLLIVLMAFAIGPPEASHPIGTICIPDANIRAEISVTGHAQDCGCCPSLWSGGIVSTTADLSFVKIGDWADIRTMDGGHYIGECVEIRTGLLWLMEPEGDIIVISGRTAYRLARL